MKDGFEQMIDAERPFFRGLAANNERAWFEPRKQRYVDDIRKPAEFFADLAAEWTCHVFVPPRVLVEATFRSNATGLFQPKAECFRRGL